MKSSPLLNDLIDALQFLPGIGPKSAQRLAYFIIEKGQRKSRILIDTLSECLEKVSHCRSCRTFSELEVCSICSNENRDRTKICVVESPLDVDAIEANSDYNGLYFVLFGRLSPLDNVLAEDLGLKQLEQRLVAGEITELIAATSMTMEGDATAFFLKEMADNSSVLVTRIAHGVPSGSELEYVNSTTILHAFKGRQKY